jgi:hypothetical protein
MSKKDESGSDIKSSFSSARTFEKENLQSSGSGKCILFKLIPERDCGEVCDENKIATKPILSQSEDIVQWLEITEEWQMIMRYFPCLPSYNCNNILSYEQSIKIHERSGAEFLKLILERASQKQEETSYRTIQENLIKVLVISLNKTLSLITLYFFSQNQIHPHQPIYNLEQQMDNLKIFKDFILFLLKKRGVALLNQYDSLLVHILSDFIEKSAQFVGLNQEDNIFILLLMYHTFEILAGLASYLESNHFSTSTTKNLINRIYGEFKEIILKMKDPHSFISSLFTNPCVFEEDTNWCVSQKSKYKFYSSIYSLKKISFLSIITAKKNKIGWHKFQDESLIESGSLKQSTFIPINNKPLDLKISLKYIITYYGLKVLKILAYLSEKSLQDELEFLIQILYNNKQHGDNLLNNIKKSPNYRQIMKYLQRNLYSLFLFFFECMSFI